jgi:hypothetical protein
MSNAGPLEPVDVFWLGDWALDGGLFYLGVRHPTIDAPFRIALHGIRSRDQARRAMALLRGKGVADPFSGEPTRDAKPNLPPDRTVSLYPLGPAG